MDPRVPEVSVSHYHLTLTLPGLPPLNTSATRRHRMVQHREARRWKELVVALVGRQRPPKPLSRAHLLVVRHSSRIADRCNMAQAAKAAVDGLVAAGVLLDDSPQVLVTERYEWERAPRGAGNLVLEVEQAAAMR